MHIIAACLEALLEASKSAVERAWGFHGSRDSAVVQGVEAGPGLSPDERAGSLTTESTLARGADARPFSWLLCEDKEDLGSGRSPHCIDVITVQR
jgi:hypothetical protein